MAVVAGRASCGRGPTEGGLTRFRPGRRASRALGSQVSPTKGRSRCPIKTHAIPDMDRIRRVTRLTTSRLQGVGLLQATGLGLTTSLLRLISLPRATGLRPMTTRRQRVGLLRATGLRLTTSLLRLISLPRAISLPRVTGPLRAPSALTVSQVNRTQVGLVSRIDQVSHLHRVSLGNRLSLRNPLHLPNLGLQVNPFSRGMARLTARVIPDSTDSSGGPVRHNPR